MRRPIPLFALALLLPLMAGTQVEAAVAPAVREAQAERVALIERIAPAVVAIFAHGGQGGGSGVLVTADGYAVTNFHVVQGLGGFMKCGLNDGKVYDAVLVGIDPTGDVALIRLLGREDFPHATIGNSDTVRVGDWAYALGNPFLLATDFQPTVTYGMVSGVHRYQYPAGTFLEYTDCIQVDTSINPGNSGGPLFNEAGELIGINGRISVEKRGRVNVGAGLCHLDQPGRQLHGPPSQWTHRRPCDTGRDSRQSLGRDGWSHLDPRDVGSLPPRTAQRR